MRLSLVAEVEAEEGAEAVGAHEDATQHLFIRILEQTAEVRIASQSGLKASLTRGRSRCQRLCRP